ncbi:MAG TPA: hypothetical protein VK002_11300 [Rubricoccaceae bacterium]|nr:hypothetical protein [Rubricoccaceae bacterium]
MPGRPLRPSSFAGLFALAALAFTGCASSSGSSALFSRELPFPSYASAEPVQGLERSTICHQGRTITIVNIAVDDHMRHGDYFGACSEANRTRHTRYYSGQATPGPAEPAPDAPVTTASVDAPDR